MSQPAAQPPSAASAINFDFGARWSEVEPHLTTVDMRRVLTRCWTAMRDDSACYIADAYDHTRAPAGQLTSCDGWAHLVMEAVQRAIDNGHPNLPPELKQPELDGDDDDDQPDEEFWEEYREYEQQVQRAIGLDFETRPTHIVHWAAAWGSCHWYNTHIGMHLAPRVCPDVQWRLLQGCDHTTVVSADGRRVFDLLAWAWDRLCGHLAGMARVETDPTLGGATAVDRAGKHCSTCSHGCP